MSVLHRLWRAIPHPLRRAVFETALTATTPGAGAFDAALAAHGQIIVAGVLRAPTGLGEAARGTIQALQAMGRDVRALDLTEAFRQEAVVAPIETPPPTPGPGVLLVFANPPMSSYAFRFIDRALVAGKLRIGSWVWEYATVPKRWRGHVAPYHRIAAPTRLVERAVFLTTGATALALPYHVAPRSVAPEDAPDPAKLRIGFIGDMLAAAGRKNPLAVVEAVGRAFGNRPDVELRMILRGAREAHPVIQGLRERADTFGLRLTLDSCLLDTDAHWARLNSLDVFCSLHRAEGFGLTIAEAMAAGLPTVATRCPAVSDYLDETVGYPVLFEAVPALPLVDDPAPGFWAEPDLDAAARALQAIDADRAAAARRGAAARARIEALYGAAAVVGAVDALVAAAVK